MIEESASSALLEEASGRSQWAPMYSGKQLHLQFPLITTQSPLTHGFREQSVIGTHTPFTGSGWKKSGQLK